MKVLQLASWPHLRLRRAHLIGCPFLASAFPQPHPQAWPPLRTWVIGELCVQGWNLHSSRHRTIHASIRHSSKHQAPALNKQTSPWSINIPFRCHHQPVKQGGWLLCPEAEGM